MKKYIIVEIIPTSRNKDTGEIIQLSALKIHDLDLIDRFDYRLKKDKIPYKQLADMIDYDNQIFTYVNESKDIIKDFKSWSKGYVLFIIDNDYTKSYLSGLKNKKESIFKYLNMTYNENIIEEVILKYNIKPTDHIVDILYEALIYESNNHK